MSQSKFDDMLRYERLIAKLRREVGALGEKIDDTVFVIEKLQEKLKQEQELAETIVLKAALRSEQEELDGLRMMHYDKSLNLGQLETKTW